MMTVVYEICDLHIAFDSINYQGQVKKKTLQIKKQVYTVIYYIEIGRIYI